MKSNTEYLIQGNIKLCVALVADIHNKPCTALIREIQSHRLDIIAVAGDIVYGA